MYFFTFTHSIRARQLGILKESAKRNGITLEFLGDGLKRFSTAKKIDLLYSRLKTIDDNEIVCAVDGFDVFFCASAPEIENRFLAMDCDCVISSERAYSHQYKKHREFFDNQTTSSPYLYVNSGSIIGYAGALKKIYKPSLSMKLQSKLFTASNINKLKRYLARAAKFLSIKDFDQNIVYSYIYYTDQQHIGRFVAKNSKKNINIKLDYDTFIFWCCAWEWRDIQKHFYLKNNRIVNIHTNNDPLIVHVPGWRAHRNVFTDLYKLHNSMTKPAFDLVLSTPDGIPEKLRNLLNEKVFPLDGDSQAESNNLVTHRVKKFHKLVLHDHEKFWYQICQFDRDIDNKQDYQEKIRRILNNVPPGSKVTIFEPLLCFFMPLWETEINNAVCVFYYSEPMECATKLQEKWRFPIQFGLALWEYYVINALKQISSKDYLLFSMAKFRQSPSNYLKQVSREYGDITGVQKMPESFEDAINKEWTLNVSTSESGENSHTAQTTLFRILESDEAYDYSSLDLSDDARDILLHYGNLRAGYEKIKTNESSLIEDIPTMQNLEKESPTHTGNFSTSNYSGESLVEIIVHVAGMPSQKFYSEIGHPMIDTLTSTLHSQSKNPNEIIFLQCGELGDSGLYFSAGDLLGIETSIVDA